MALQIQEIPGSREAIRELDDSDQEVRESRSRKAALKAIARQMAALTDGYNFTLGYTSEESVAIYVAASAIAKATAAALDREAAFLDIAKDRQKRANKALNTMLRKAAM